MKDMQPVEGHQGCLQRSNALPHGISSSRAEELQLHTDAATGSSYSSSDASSDDAGDSDVSEIVLTEEESIDMDSMPAAIQLQPSQLIPSSSKAAADEPVVELGVSAPDLSQQQQQQQHNLPVTGQLHSAAYADIKQKSADLSRAVSSLLQELLLATTDQLQGHSIALLASSLSACAPQVAAAAAAATAASSNGASGSSAASSGIVEAAAKHAAAEQLRSPAGQLVLAPLLADMATLER
jgi:hypothetical protein